MKQNACNLNIQTYSLEEMLEEWKTRKMLLPGRRDCTVERDDGIDLDAVLVREIEAAYDRLLREAPTEAAAVLRAYASDDTGGYFA